MPSMFVRPKPGGRVRMPDREYRPMPEEGALVPCIDFYERLVITGDLVKATPQPQPQATSAAAAAPKRRKES